MKTTKIQTEAVEVCPFCEQENVYPNWDVEKQGYVARCHHCGKLIMLCDECMHLSGVQRTWIDEASDASEPQAHASQTAIVSAAVSVFNPAVSQNGLGDHFQ